jgi:hypothetical protein
MARLQKIRLGQSYTETVMLFCRDMVELRGELAVVTERLKQLRKQERVPLLEV